MNGTNIRKPIIKTMQNACREVLQKSRTTAAAANRVANMQKLSYVKKTYARGKGYFIGGCKPVVDGLCDMSDNIDVIRGTVKKVQKKIRNVSKKDIDKSGFSATLDGIRESAPEIKAALKEIIGANDVKAATEQGGILLGAKEAGKAAIRVVSSTALFIAGNLVPVPASSVAGWIAGERIANTIMGKPFTKQIGKVIKK